MPWTITTWVPGEPADRAAITRGSHSARALGAFLSALHKVAPADAPANPKRSVALGELTEDFDDKTRVLASKVDTSAVQKVWEEAGSTPAWQGPRIWPHGDLHPANVVVSEGALSGVIDFGELCFGDPATDLAAAWTLLPAGETAAFFQSYGATDDAMVRRARGWAVLMAVTLIGIGMAWERGLPGGKRTWGPAGRHILARVLASHQQRPV